MRVADVMTSKPITVAPEDSLKSAAQEMVDRGISGLPVADEQGHLVGIITEADFLHWEGERAPTRRQRLLDVLFGNQNSVRGELTDVASAMTTDVVTAVADMSLTEAARLMERHRIKRLPVVDGDGRIVGIISRADIMRTFTRPDEDLERVVREDLAKGVLLADPADIHVSVEDGLVTLAGTLDTKSDAELLRELALREDGVIGVDSKLKWRVDQESGSWA